MKSYRFNNETGSSLVMALTAAVILSLSVYAALHISGGLNLESNRARTEEEAAAFAQSIKALASNPTVCKDGIDGSGGQAGLRFMTENGSSITVLDLAQATSPDGQKVHFGSNFPPGPTPPLGIMSGDVINDFNLQINRLAIKLPPGSPGPPSRYTAQLVARLQSSRFANYALRERVLSNIVMNVDAAGNISDCMAERSNLTPDSMCASMGCNYDPSLVGQKCICPLPPAFCPPGQYIKGLNPIDLSPICADVTVACPAGQFLVAIQTNGDPVCSSITPPPGPAPGPAPACLTDGTLTGGDHVFPDNSYNFTLWTGSGISEVTNLCCSSVGTARSPSCPTMNCAAIDVAVKCLGSGPAPAPGPAPGPGPAPLTCSCPDIPATGSERYRMCSPGVVNGSLCEVASWELYDTMSSNVGPCLYQPSTCAYASTPTDCGKQPLLTIQSSGSTIATSNSSPVVFSTGGCFTNYTGLATINVGGVDNVVSMTCTTPSVGFGINPTYTCTPSGSATIGGVTYTMSGVISVTSGSPGMYYCSARFQLPSDPPLCP